jgi:hypothetical protein
LLWYKYIFPNCTEIQLGNQELKDSIIQQILDTEIHEFHLQKAFAFATERVRRDFWASFHSFTKVAYNPQIVRNGGFNYTFDAIIRSGEKAVFVKVFSDPLENCKRDEFKKIQKAVMLVNKYYDSHVFIFSKRRFSDYAAQQAPRDETLSFIEVERLKF